MNTRYATARAPHLAGATLVLAGATLCLAGAILAMGAGTARAAAARYPAVESRPTGVTPGIATGAWTVTYDGFAHGLLVLKMHASLTFAATAYTGALSFHTAGMVGWMVHNADDSQVTGHFLAGADGDATLDRAMPDTFDSVGNLRGVDRVTRMIYRDGSPVITMLTPPVVQERTPVPPTATPHTIDTLSAIAMLVRQVGLTGRCDGGTTIFDGRRLTSLTARTVGTQALPVTDRSIFSGDTLRCDFEGNQLAGFKLDESEAEQRATKHGNAWLASVLPHAPPIPVKVIFDNKALGQVTLFLTSASAAPGAVASRGQ